jgi:hypothetical protein
MPLKEFLMVKHAWIMPVDGLANSSILARLGREQALREGHMQTIFSAWQDWLQSWQDDFATQVSQAPSSHAAGDYRGLFGRTSMWCEVRSLALEISATCLCHRSTPRLPLVS